MGNALILSYREGIQATATLGGMLVAAGGASYVARVAGVGRPSISIMIGMGGAAAGAYAAHALSGAVFDGMELAIEKTEQTIRDGVNTLKDGFKTVTDTFGDVGKNVIGGAKKGIKNVGSTIANGAKSVGKAVGGFFKHPFGIGK